MNCEQLLTTPEGGNVGAAVVAGIVGITGTQVQAAAVVSEEGGMVGA
jgi:hypothetical protein